MLPMNREFHPSATPGESLAAAKVIDVYDFGAQGDGRTLNIWALQRAIDAVHNAGGGVVSLPADVFLIGGLVLRATAPSSTQSVIHLRNCRDVFVHGNRAPVMSGAFLHVSGERSAVIALAANDLSRAASTSVFTGGASSAALISH